MSFAKMYGFLLVCMCCILSACVESDNYAPVTDLSYIEQIPKTGMHRVRKGETLYEISWRYGLDYRYLAQRNNIKPPYTIQENQIITLKENYSKQPKLSPITQTSRPANNIKVMTQEKEPNYSSSGWVWPAQGKIIHYFSATNKGINIAGAEGEPIYAAASGKVVYSGNGLRGYGNLIIIKHNSLYLSAYAHNKQVLVKEGDWIKKGQKISGMGNTGTDVTMLHFEIRRAGKPIDPLALYNQKVV